MKKIISFLVCASARLLVCAYAISPVPFTNVQVQGGFWGQRIQACREVTVPLAFSKCEETGRYLNFVRAANPSPDYEVGGLSFDDTDVYKTIEGASYLMQTYPDAAMDAYIDSVLAIVAAAQEPDGYLYTSRTMNPAKPHFWAGERRWQNVEILSHEFYNLGHMVEGAIAHYQATGKRGFLDIAIRYADCVCREIGEGEGQQVKVPGHPIAEMALAKLYLLTGERRYLDQAKFFLDWRGRTECKDWYQQCHKPLLEMTEAEGHAVRATYLYAGMADVAALTGDSAYIRGIDRIWENIVGKKMYITGGIGARAWGECFGDNYELPNMTAYCETCAAIGQVYVNHRLFLLHGQSKYYDIVERVMHNGLISGMSMDGGAFFYPNPLESVGQHQRQPWFGCACCPSNISRFMPSVPGYVYAVRDRDVYVNLYMASRAQLSVGGKGVELSQQTDYPWQGDIAVTVERNAAGEFALRLRLPGWAQGQPVPSDLYRYVDGRHTGHSLTVNGKAAECELRDGYLTITRKWRKGDKVQLHLDMEPRLVAAHDSVAADRGCVAVERGPLVYCAEQPDNDFDIMSLYAGRLADWQTGWQQDLGMATLTASAQAIVYAEDGALAPQDVRLTMIPYYAWAHRGASKMMVWLPRQLNAVRSDVQALSNTNETFH